MTDLEVYVGLFKEAQSSFSPSDVAGASDEYTRAIKDQVKTHKAAYAKKLKGRTALIGGAALAASGLAGLGFSRSAKTRESNALNKGRLQGATAGAVAGLVAPKALETYSQFSPKPNGLTPDSGYKYI